MYGYQESGDLTPGKQGGKFGLNTGAFITKFELNDTMAEELINLAIIMSTEITESSRLTSKMNTRPLES